MSQTFVLTVGVRNGRAYADLSDTVFEPPIAEVEAGTPDQAVRSLLDKVTFDSITEDDQTPADMDDWA